MKVAAQAADAAGSCVEAELGSAGGDRAATSLPAIAWRQSNTSQIMYRSQAGSISSLD